MPTTPKRRLEQIDNVLNAWETLRPAKSFGGATLKQFKDAVKPCLEARSALATAEKNIIAAQTQREAADKAIGELIQRIVKSVRADLEEGDDGALYEAMGYVRRSDRKSGLTRRRQAPSAGAN